MVERYDWEAVAVRLADMARDLLSQDSVQATLDRITEHAVKLVEGCDAAGILVVRKREVLTIASTDNVARVSDRLQVELREGPCFDATTQKQHVYRIADMTIGDFWPEYTPRARELGIGSMMGFLLFTTGTDNLGALNMYSQRPDAFTEDSERIGLMVASHAAVALASARQEANLRVALDTSRTIGEAIGIVMARHKTTETEAFELLLQASQTTNTKLRNVAETVTQTGDIPDRGE
jgi:transcriptional regulator with GAF, ATPase, and Fis domain